MFSIDPSPTFASQVKLTRPGDAPAGQITITWRHMGREQLREWLDAMADSSLSDVDGLLKAIAGWDGVVDKLDQTVEFSRAALARLLDAYQTAGAELVRAYVTALTESRLGN